MTNSLDVPGYQQQAQAARLLYRAQIEFVDALDKELAQYDMTAAQYAIVAALASGRASSVGQICKELAYDTGAMTRMLDRMERKDILRRVRSVEDRRSVMVELTPHGKSIYPELLASSSKVMASFFGHFSASELDQLEGLLSRVTPRVSPVF
ncbi:MarR family winged helix-turn-helix transcriptional regulator [Solimicrobium silvestre]|uniref:Transcriptional regulator n=1 Tax=Solimicrobium silvestre TaxID=2099400 RepID=A0A2S9GV69_9BURK|nr:MarR family transcriptional regulator [Solimicrobium silvestre]PRC91556.1 Transcriptional regulator [Solimicrobium silvestre]